MSPRRPNPDEFAALAAELGLHLGAVELETYRTSLDALLGAYDRIEALGDALPASPAGRRWWRPEPEENPHGAWYVRTEIPGADRGPLAGKCVALKDNVMLAGVPMMNGSAALEGYVAEVDATIVTRLLAAGAEIRGKAHCEDLCLSGGSHTCHAGPVHNPHRRGHSAGGSSSGSAALVAAGEVELAVGGDQGGSIRIPAAFCGTVGMKPTFGLVPYTGVAPIEPTLDHTGPISACILDNARMLEVMAGPDGIDARQSGTAAGRYAEGLDAGVAGLRVGLLAEGFGRPESQTAVDDAVRAAGLQLEKAGARVEEISIPIHGEAALLTLPLLVEGLWRTVLAGAGQGAGRPDVYVPGFMAWMARWREHADALSPMLKSIALAGAWVDREGPGLGYARAANQARRVRNAYDAAFAEVDVLLMPTAPMTAPPLPAPDAPLWEQFARSGEMTGNTQPFDASHHPALSVPCGDVDGLPVGAMLVGPHLSEALLYRVGYVIEQARG